MPRRRTSVFEKMFSDNRLRSIPDSEQQGTLCVEYWTSKILIELSGYKSLELDDVQEMANIRVVKAWQQEIENDVSELYELKGKEEGDTELLDDAGDSVFSRYKSVKTELRKRIDNPPVSMKKVYRNIKKEIDLHGFYPKGFAANLELIKEAYDLSEDEGLVRLHLLHSCLSKLEKSPELFQLFRPRLFPRAGGHRKNVGPAFGKGPRNARAGWQTYPNGNLRRRQRVF